MMSEFPELARGRGPRMSIAKNSFNSDAENSCRCRFQKRIFAIPCVWSTPASRLMDINCHVRPVVVSPHGIIHALLSRVSSHFSAMLSVENALPEKNGHYHLEVAVDSQCSDQESAVVNLEVSSI